MQIVENWSDVQGDLKHLSPNTSDPTFSLATLTVDSAADVESFPNLLRQKVGNEITVKIPQAAVKRTQLAPGDHIKLRIRQAGIDRYFSHPDHLEKS